MSHSSDSSQTSNSSDSSQTSHLSDSSQVLINYIKVSWSGTQISREQIRMIEWWQLSKWQYKNCISKILNCNFFRFTSEENEKEGKK